LRANQSFALRFIDPQKCATCDERHVHFTRRTGNLIQSDLFPNEVAQMYHQSQNENGTYNTRCLDCLMNVATAVETTQELKEIEDRHCCAEKALTQLLANQPKSSSNSCKTS